MEGTVKTQNSIQSSQLSPTTDTANTVRLGPLPCACTRMPLRATPSYHKDLAFALPMNRLLLTRGVLRASDRLSRYHMSSCETRESSLSAASPSA
jgi:hypothetical protein